MYCQCEGTKKEKKKNWQIMNFIGSHTKPWSVVCLKCNGLWSTNGKYAKTLEDHPDKIKFDKWLEDQKKAAQAGKDGE